VIQTVIQATPRCDAPIWKRINIVLTTLPQRNHSLSEQKVGMQFPKVRDQRVIIIKLFTELTMYTERRIASLEEHFSVAEMSRFS
jgi:hypothetical protein